jgi:1-deoxy-D-xylulose-5-phosphate reductoisomerase
MVKKKVMILGCTGSIGTTALNMLDKHRDSFQIVAISAHSNKDLLFSIARHLVVLVGCLQHWFALNHIKILPLQIKRVL